jgi:hypothetical protein
MMPHEGFEGDKWSTNVNITANDAGLFEDIEDINPLTAISRDDAAQMLWNALNAGTVTYAYQLTTVNGELQSLKIPTLNDAIVDTLYWKNMKGNIDEAVLTDITYDDNEKQYFITLSNFNTYYVENDPSDLFGMNVKDPYDRTDPNAIVDAYGIYAHDSLSWLPALSAASPMTTPRLQDQVGGNSTRPRLCPA